MDIKVLHIVGGHSENGAFKGAKILHKALLKAKIKSKIFHGNSNLKIAHN